MGGKLLFIISILLPYSMRITMKYKDELPSQYVPHVDIMEELPTIWLEGLKKEMATVENMLMQVLDNVNDSHPLPAKVAFSVRYKVIPEVSITILRDERLS